MMEIKILDSAYIVGFNSDTNFLRNQIRIKIFESVGKVVLQELTGWKLYIYFRYNNVEDILIYLKGRSVPQTKEKEITIHIPMPIRNKVDWGVAKEDHIYDNPKHLDDKLKNFDQLSVDFSKFLKREDYIADCMWRAVIHCFKKGFKINGIELKMDM
ncbi:Imm9 family immunity protein [Pedobacter helvus]|uniref:Imm9 family immunity protein n=1 Tax=Pedobacter helvus TaxID=2563444 RepID=A0ABW9JDJ4_9SPHI|nr:Imm9 family immunity protein [Pedobacter ureilyticus]